MEPHLNLSVVKSNERMYYGRTVMATLKQLRIASTLTDVIRFIANNTGQPEELVRGGVKQSLIRGTRMGFIRRNGNKFMLPYPIRD